MTVKNPGTHATHCCAIHRCKYGEEDCPVVSHEIEQVYTCEWCDEDGIKTVDQVKDIVLLHKQLNNSLANNESEVKVNTATLALLLKI